MLRLSFVATPHKSKVRYSLLLLDATLHKLQHSIGSTGYCSRIRDNRFFGQSMQVHTLRALNLGRIRNVAELLLIRNTHSLLH